MDGLEEERRDQLETILMPVSPNRGMNEGDGDAERKNVNSALREKRRCVRPAPDAWFSFCAGKMRFLGTLNQR